MTNSAQRLAAAYDRRKTNTDDRYSFFNAANLHMVQMRERKTLELFKLLGITNFAEKKILDIGCGGGRELVNFVRYGAEMKNCHGIDLLEERVAAAKQKLPSSRILCGDAASNLPWPDGHFDVITQFTVFTSILESDVKSSLAKEILRVLSPNGILLWYDFHIDNPRNPDVKGVKKAEIKMLFPDCRVVLNKITLAPPLIRLIAPYSTIFCAFLEKLQFLNTHYLGYIQKI